MVNFINIAKKKNIKSNLYNICINLVLQENVATLGGTLPGLMAEGDQEEETESNKIDIKYY